MFSPSTAPGWKRQTKLGRLDGGTARGECCTRQEQRIKAQAHQREPTCFDEDTPIDHLGSLRPTVQPLLPLEVRPTQREPNREHAGPNGVSDIVELIRDDSLG